MPSQPNPLNVMLILNMISRGTVKVKERIQSSGTQHNGAESGPLEFHVLQLLVIDHFFKNSIYKNDDDNNNHCDSIK